MKPDLHDLDSLIRAAQELRRAQASFEKRSAKARDVDLSMSQRAIGKAEADMHWDGLHVDRCWDTLHARAVDLGLCDPKEPEAYAPREIQWSRMHGQVYQPAMPRCIASQAGGGK